MNIYAKMTDQDFNRHYDKVTDELSKVELLAVPGVYELISEFYNNEILDSWAEAANVYAKLVYESQENPGYYGFTGCESDDYETEEEAEEAAREYYAEPNLKTRAKQ